MNKLSAALSAAVLACTASTSHAISYKIDFGLSGVKFRNQLAPFNLLPSAGGHNISGSYLIDVDSAGSDRRPHQRSEAFGGRSSNFIQTTFNHDMQWTYDAAGGADNHYDGISVTRLNGKDRVIINDFFTLDQPTSATDSVSCGGINKKTDYCWAINLNFDLAPASFRWGETLTADFDDLLRASLKMRLVNYSPEFGFITNNHYLGGALTSFSLTTVGDDVTPVPLPAAGWLFLSAIGAGYLSLRKKVNRAETLAN